MTRTIALLAAASIAVLSAPAHADDAFSKPVSTLVSAVRYGKDAMALKQMDGDAQGAVLMGAEWQKGMPAQREEFIDLFHKLFAAMAFPRIRDNFKNLAATNYEPGKPAGSRAELRSTIVIDHPVQKKELKVRYDLAQSGGWKVVDVTVLSSGGQSMLTEIRNEQVKPLFAKHGWDGLLKLMRDRLAQLKK